MDDMRGERGSGGSSSSTPISSFGHVDRTAASMSVTGVLSSTGGIIEEPATGTTGTLLVAASLSGK